MSDRFNQALVAAVRGAQDRNDLFGLYEYRVVLQAGPRVDLQIVDPKTGMPDLPQVVSRLGLGAKTTFKLGASVLVSFVDGKQSRPVILHVAGETDPGWTPDSIDVDADEINLGDALGTVLREGDTINVGVATGVVTIVTGQGVPPSPSKVKA